MLNLSIVKQTLGVGLALAILLPSCKVTSNTYLPSSHFAASTAPPPPDYTLLDNWAAHPDKADPADRTPANYLKDEQATAQADVFFVYPTIYDGSKKDQTSWNASISDTFLNNKIDGSTILHQSSVFNGAGKIYAPRYRQAHLQVYYKTANKEDAKAALDLAYEDVKAAFQYYLKNYNNGRPIIIASHSQGSTHSKRLLKEFFDGQPLQKQLVAAYLVGMPINKDIYTAIPPCETPEQTGCFCTWNVYSKDYYPNNWAAELKYATATNPLIWVTDGTYASAEENKGGVLSKFNVKPNLVDAQVKEGMVWINKPNVTGAFLVRTKRWHYAEYNLFYFNIRENAQLRVAAFLKKE